MSISCTVITTRQRSCGKVVFSLVSVCLFIEPHCTSTHRPPQCTYLTYFSGVLGSERWRNLRFADYNSCQFIVWKGGCTALVHKSLKNSENVKVSVSTDSSKFRSFKTVHTFNEVLVHRRYFIEFVNLPVILLLPVV